MEVIGASSADHFIEGNRFLQVIEALAVYLSSLEGLGSSPLELHVAIESGTAASHSCSTKCNIKGACWSKKIILNFFVH